MADADVLRPSAAARRLGVKTRVVIEAMYDHRLPGVPLDDGTLGVPSAALDSFELPA